VLGELGSILQEGKEKGLEARRRGSKHTLSHEMGDVCENKDLLETIVGKCLSWKRGGGQLTYKKRRQLGTVASICIFSSGGWNETITWVHEFKTSLSNIARPWTERERRRGNEKQRERRRLIILAHCFRSFSPYLGPAALGLWQVECHSGEHMVEAAGCSPPGWEGKGE
jgi:hypothetical protein